MARGQRSAVGRATDALADATGMSQEEVRVALTAAVVAAGLLAALRFLKFLADLGTDVFDRSRR